MAGKVKKVSMRIADVTYTLVSTESEESILRAGQAAEKLIEAVRDNYPDLNLYASTVLALVNAIGAQEDKTIKIEEAEAAARDAEMRYAVLEREMAALRAQNNILLRETRPRRPMREQPDPPVEESIPEPEPVPEIVRDEQTVDRHKKDNITFLIDPRIEAAAAAEYAEESDETGESPVEGRPPFWQTGIEELNPDD